MPVVILYCKCVLFHVGKGQRLLLSFELKSGVFCLNLVFGWSFRDVGVEL